MEKYIVKLTKEERENLLSLTKTGKHSAYKILHARILLESDEGDCIDRESIKTDKEAAKLLDIDEKTVIRLRKRFVEEGLEASLARKAHSRTRTRKIMGEEEAYLIAICCSNPPEGRSRWTLKLLSDQLMEMEVIESVSPATVGRTLNKNELKPWQKREWCIPEASAEFVCKMEDVLDVYKRPYNEKYPVVCMDESSKQHLKETRKPIPMKPGESQRYDSEYERNGTSNIFLSYEPLKGKRNLKVTDHRKKKDWADFIKELVDNDYADAEKVVLVMDNLNTHTGSSLYERFPPAEAKRILDKLEIHYTPKHGSWLNIAEIELSHLSRQCLDRRIPDQETMRNEVLAWTKTRNKEATIVNWQFTTDDARIKLKRLYPVLSLGGQN